MDTPADHRQLLLLHQKYMVVGGDSFLGGYINKMLKMSCKRIITTSRNPRNLSDTCIYLDMKDDISSWEFPEDIDTAFLCAAVTSTEECRIHTDKTRIVNVENTITLAIKLLKKDVSVIFPSTNLVFDGQHPGKKPDDSVCPCVEYGRQKAEVESRLSGSAHIVRFTKILAPQMPLITGWVEQLKNKKVIHPFSDMVLSPIPIDFASEIMLKIAHTKQFGTWHISGEKDITYERLARYLAEKMGISQRYVQPVKAEDSGLEFESIPKYTTLDILRIKKEFGLTPPNIWDTIDSLFLR